MLAEAIAGELISSRDRDPLRPRRGPRRRARAPARARARRLFALAARQRRRARRDRHAPAGPTTASSRSSTPSTTAASRTGCSTSPGATTRSRCTSTSACAAPTAPSRVCDRLRPVLPLLLAISANSPFLDGARLRPALGAHADLHEVASRAAASPTPSARWAAYRDYVDLLVRTNSIVEFTQVWWSVRPHSRFGTVEVRICDAQATARRVRGAGRADRRLRRAGRARRWTRACRSRDPPAPPDRGEHVARDPLRARRPAARPRRAAIEEYPAARGARPAAGLDGAGARRAGIEPRLPELNGAQRQRALIDAGREPATRSTPQPSSETRATYAQEEVQHDERPRIPATAGRRVHRGGAARRLRGRDEARSRVDDVARSRRSCRCSTSARRKAGLGARQPRTSATSSRCAWRSRARARCCRSLEAALGPNAAPLRDALSQLQMAYAQMAGGAARRARRRAGGAAGAGRSRAGGRSGPRAPGPAQRSGPPLGPGPVAGAAADGASAGPLATIPRASGRRPRARRRRLRPCPARAPRAAATLHRLRRTYP